MVYSQMEPPGRNPIIQSIDLNPPLDILAPNECCVVCGDTADGFHYGVRSCRGCNAFFRRAITYDMQFSCRRGGKCAVDKNGRCACRACRLTKCLNAGMDKKAVQPKRGDMTGLPHERPSPEEMKEYKPSPSDIPLNGNGYNNQPSQNTNGSTALSSLDLFMPAVPPSPPPDSGVIAMQCFDYQDQKRRRRALLCDTLEELLDEGFDSALRRRAIPEDWSALFQVQMVLMFEWAEKLHEFRELQDPNDKTKLLKSFALRYLLLDNVFHTTELGYSDRLVLVNNAYMMPNDFPDFASMEPAHLTRIKIQMFGPELQAMIDDVITPMTRMRLSVGEKMTLRMIMFWNPGMVGLTPQGLHIAQEASNVAVKELHRYFDQEGITDVDQRIGNLLLLLPALQRHVHVLYDMVKLIPTFGKMSEWDSFMDELLRGF